MARLAPWIPWAKKPPTLAKSRRYCARAIKGHRTKKDFGFLMFSKKTGELVGGIGLHRVDWTIPKLEIGYWIGTRFEGLGYVTEAVRALTDAAFKKLGAVRMELLCDGHNTRAQSGQRNRLQARESTVNPGGITPGTSTTCAFTHKQRPPR